MLRRRDFSGAARALLSWPGYSSMLFEDGLGQITEAKFDGPATKLRELNSWAETTLSEAIPKKIFLTVRRDILAEKYVTLLKQSGQDYSIMGKTLNSCTPEGFDRPLPDLDVLVNQTEGYYQLISELRRVRNKHEALSKELQRVQIKPPDQEL